MPKYQITAPDGNKFEVTAPEGASQEQVLAYVKANYKGASKPSAKEQIANDAITKSAQRTLSVTTPELISANPVVRMLTSAARPVMGAAALMEAPFGGTSNLERIKQLDEMQRKGAEALGFSGPVQTAQDVSGALMGPATLGAMKLPAATTAMERILQSAGLGGTVGAISNPENPYSGAATGAAIGGAIPAGWGVLKTVGRGVRNVGDLFLGETGAKRILDRYIGNAVGRENIPVVTRAIRRGQGEPIPGYKPTVAEAVAGEPAGSPLVAHQRITSTTPGGPSAQFGNRIADQKAAISAAQEARDATVVPKLIQSLKTADQNGIQTAGIIKGIDNTIGQPGFRASSVVQKTLNQVKEKLSSLTKDGVINGQDLWAVRKEIGNFVKTASKETNNWDKRLTARLESQIQKSIDKAIVDAGAKDWPQHMAAYAARSQAIQRVKDTAKAAMRPEQKTDLFGGLRVAEETRTHLPQLLSRPMMAANAIMRYFSANIEPKIDTLATRRYLNPKEFADALEKLPKPTQNKIVEAMKRIGIAQTVLTGSQLANEKK